jgi:uncharacterized protein (DUF849 family)
VGLQAALNGDRTKAEHAATPVSVEELARDGAACVGAGARAIHLHLRDFEGRQTLEAGVWSVEDAERLAACGLGGQLTRILVEPGELQLRDSSGDKASGALGLVEDIHGVLDELGLASPRLQHGDGRLTWVLLRDALRRGLDTRVGLEDTLRGPDGERTTGNEALVRAARELGAA